MVGLLEVGTREKLQFCFVKDMWDSALRCDRDQVHVLCLERDLRMEQRNTDPHHLRAHKIRFYS